MSEVVLSRITAAASLVRELGAVVRKARSRQDVDAPSGGLLERGATLAGIGAWECELSTNSLSWTDGVYDLFGLPRGYKIRREEAVALYSEESRAEMERLRAHAIAKQQSFTLDAKILTAEGGHRWMRVTTGIISASGRATHLFGLKQDVTQERYNLEALRKSAEHDALTGLASRNVFQSRFLNASATARANFPVAMLILFDIDGFKGVNDQNGHAAGDACLESVAVRLRRCFPDASMIARVGGDEFAILMPAAMGDSLTQRLRTCLSHLAEPIMRRGQLLYVTASAGVAVSLDRWAYDPDQMFSAADIALYSAKRAGRNRMHVAA